MIKKQLKYALACILFLYSYFNCEMTQAQNIAIKSNILYDLTGTINLGTEFGIGKKWTVDISGNLNLWNYNSKSNAKFRHLMIQPEVRYWLCERFAGHFFGANLLWSNFNIGGIDLPLGITDNTIAKYRYRGDLFGTGISYGYQWFFRRRWAVEAEFGLGYAYMKYNKYDCKNCGELRGKYKNHYWGPTKAAISLIYFIK